MRELKRKNGESLDNAMHRLKELGTFNQPIYMNFDGHNIYSSYTLDEAYKEVYGFTRDKYLAKQVQSEMNPVEEETESLFKYTPSDVIRDLKTAILIHDIDYETGLYHSEVAKEYIKYMSKYAKYCKESTQDEWTQSIIYYVYSVGKTTESGEEELPEDVLEEILDFYEKLGKIMKLISDNASWIEIGRLVKSYNLTKEDTENLKQCMMHYSPRGEEFIVNVFGKGPMTLKK